MKHHNTFIIIVTAVFLVITCVFCFFPRPKTSMLERRELAEFPEYTMEKLTSGDFTKELSHWFSDSEPFRDQIMTFNMELKERMGLPRTGEDNITIHADNSEDDATEAESGQPEEALTEFKVSHGADEKAKIASRGIIVVGSAPNARALMIYGGVNGGEKYAEAANTYYDRFGGKVNVYAMVIPNSTEYYIPDKIKDRSKSMYTTVKRVHEKLKPGVKAVDVYTPLAKHVDEPIFLRTDHHWAPLGAYYAAQKFAQVAGVPFKDLSTYEKHVIHDYVGTMYGFSKDISLKKSPEDFVYYTPTGVTYTTTYTDYKVDKDFNVISEKEPMQGEFFQHYKDGSGAAYCTFMGSDMRLTKVVTSTKNGRKLIILKDSFGNAIPGYLFGSFEEIHVIDGRYFNKNMTNYVKNNGITDILFAHNVFKVYDPNVGKRYIEFLDTGK